MRGVLPGLLGRVRVIEQTPARIIEVTQPVGLKPVRQSPKQQMTGQMRGWSPAEYSMPTAAQLSDVELAQPRNLDIKCCAVRQCRTESLRAGSQSGGLVAGPAASGRDLVDPIAVYLLGGEF